MNDSTPASNRIRVQHAQRSQIEMQLFALDQLIDQDHQVRIVWAYVQSLNLDPLFRKFKVDQHSTGRSAIDPAILMTLWLYATLDGVGSAREVARRCKDHLPYMWICGGVGVNYHTLSDFRVENTEFLESVLVDSIASLVDQGLVPLKTIAQDGMRVRASAGTSSFRRSPSLDKLQQLADDHLKKLQAENEGERNEADKRTEAAKLRAAEERQKRIAEARRQQEKLAEQREKRRKGTGKETRVSTTDPDARKMKMPNGGFDPAFNVQFSSDADTRIIVDFDVVNQGTDSGLLKPSTDRVKERYKKSPNRVLVDSAYTTQSDVTDLERVGTRVYGTLPNASKLLRNGKDPHERQSRDSDEYARFRHRMRSRWAQLIYQLRPSVAEFPNADCRNRGLYQFTVRGLKKVRSVTLWHILAFNLRRLRNLGILEAVMK